MDGQPNNEFLVIQILDRYFLNKMLSPQSGSDPESPTKHESIDSSNQLWRHAIIINIHSIIYIHLHRQGLFSMCA